MEVKAKLRYYRMSARKVRLVADLVRGRQVDEAVNILNFSPKKAARSVAKLINAAVADADETKELDVDRLFVKKIWVDEGPTLKRFRPRAMGRATRIRKRTSHVTVILDEM